MQTPRARGGRAVRGDRAAGAASAHRVRQARLARPSAGCLSVRAVRDGVRAALATFVPYVRMRTPDGAPIAWGGGCPAFTLAAGGDAARADRTAQALEAARDAWQGGEGACDRPPIDVTGGGDGGDVGYDGVNRVLWRETDHCLQPGTEDDELCLAPNAAAITTVFFYERGGRAGELIEADVEINGEMAFASDGSADRVDLISALTHELGHVLGLEHTCETIPGRAPGFDSSGASVPYCFPLEAVPAEARAATMFPYLEAGKLDARTPLPAERAALCELYGDRPRTCDDVGPGCGCAGANGSSLVLVLVLLAVQQLCRRSVSRRRQHVALIGRRRRRLPSSRIDSRSRWYGG